MISGTANPESLREFLENTGIKQSFMAKKWGISASYLNRIIVGERRPSADLARIISGDTGIPLENLLFPQEHAAKT